MSRRRPTGLLLLLFPAATGTGLLSPRAGDAFPFVLLDDDVVPVAACGCSPRFANGLLDAVELVLMYVLRKPAFCFPKSASTGVSLVVVVVLGPDKRSLEGEGEAVNSNGSEVAVVGVRVPLEELLVAMGLELLLLVDAAFVFVLDLGLKTDPMLKKRFFLGLEGICALA